MKTMEGRTINARHSESCPNWPNVFCQPGRAAQEYRVPQTTLQDQVSGGVIYSKKPGPAPYLNNEELESYLVEAAQMGYGKSR